MSFDKGSVLVACPTYAGKEYCLDEWVDGFDKLIYHPKFAYQVDNTRGSLLYFKRLQDTGIDCTHLEPYNGWDRTFFKCWQLMLQRAKQLNCYWVYSVEADNIPAPESLEVMIDIALFSHIHLVTHVYPMHQSAADASGLKGNEFYYNELGCMLMTTSLLERAIREFEEYGNIALAIFATCERYMGGSCKLTNRFEVKHLDGYHQSYQNLAPSELRGLMIPTPKMPDDYGTELPPSLKHAFN